MPHERGEGVTAAEQRCACCSPPRRCHPPLPPHAAVPRPRPRCWTRRRWTMSTAASKAPRCGQQLRASTRQIALCCAAPPTAAPLCAPMSRQPPPPPAAQRALTRRRRAARNHDQEEYFERLAASATLYIGNMSFYTTEEQVIVRPLLRHRFLKTNRVRTSCAPSLAWGWGPDARCSCCHCIETLATTSAHKQPPLGGTGLRAVFQDGPRAARDHGPRLAAQDALRLLLRRLRPARGASAGV